MKETNLYEIKEKAIKTGKVVWNTAELGILINKPRDIAKVYAYRLVKKGMAKKITKSRISFVENPLLISTQIVEPSYISCITALYFHKLIQQVPNKVEAITTKNTLKFPKFDIYFHKISPKLFFGYKKYTKENVTLFVAEPEKAFLDSIYFGKISDSLISSLKAKIDKRKLRKYAKDFIKLKTIRTKKIRKLIENDR